MKTNYIRKQIKQFTYATFATALILTTNQTFAGDRVGNGGDAVVCPNGKVELLDHYEARKKGMTIDISGNTLREKVQTLVDRFKKFDYVNGAVIEKTAIEMVSDLETNDYSNYKVVLMTNDKLVDIKDSHETSIPNGCRKEQLVINKDVVYSQDRKFEMRADLWIQMSLTNKAMTVTHEAIYNRFIEAGAIDSRFSRYLNGYFSQKDSNLDFSNYISDLKRESSSLMKLEYDIPNISGGISYYNSYEERGLMVIRNTTMQKEMILKLLKVYDNKVVLSPGIKEYLIDLSFSNQIERPKRFRLHDATFNSYGEISTASIGFSKNEVEFTNGKINFKLGYNRLDVKVSQGTRIMEIVPVFDDFRNVYVEGVKYRRVNKVSLDEEGNIIKVETRD